MTKKKKGEKGSRTMSFLLKTGSKPNFFSLFLLAQEEKVFP